MFSITNVILLIIAMVIIGIVGYHNGCFNMRGFVGTMESVLIEPGCPNYMVTDGHKYYLIFNNKDFDGVNNPLIFDSEREANIELGKRNCGNKLTPIYLRRPINQQIDPTVSYERTCALKTASPLYWLNDCAYTIANNSTDMDLQPIDPEVLLNPEEVARKKAQKLLDTPIDDKTDKYKILRQLNDFLNGQDTKTRVNYDIETCMINELGNDRSTDFNTGSTEILQKYGKYFNNKTAESLPGSVDLDEKALMEFNNYFTNANELAIPDKMLDTIFNSV